MVAFAGYPLLVDDRLVGVIALFARRPLSDHTLQAMASISNGIALAIECRWAEQAWRRRLGRRTTSSPSSRTNSGRP